MAIYSPFFYIIRHIPSGLKYAGCRYSRKSDPEKFMTKQGYKTSSSHVHEMIKRDGLDSFEIIDLILECDIKIPFGWNSVYEFESDFLVTHGCAGDQTWINRHNNNRGGFSDRTQKYGFATFIDPNTSKNVYIKVSVARALGWNSLKTGSNHHFYGKSFKCPPGHSKGEANGMFGKKQPSMSARNQDPKFAAENGIRYSNFILNQGLNRFCITLSELQRFITNELCNLPKRSIERKVKIISLYNSLLTEKTELNLDRFIRLIKLEQRMVDRKILDRHPASIGI